MDEKLLERIRALLRLAESNCNEHEASLAMERAQALLLKHNLTAAQVGTSEVNAQSQVGLDRWEWKPAPWKRGLVGAIARAYLCRAIGTPHHVIVVGRPENIAVAESIWNWLVTQVESICLREALAVDSRARRSWRTSWLLGCASRLSERLRESANGLTSDETALVVSHKKENADFIGKYWHLAPVKIPTIGDYSAYSAGLSAGSGISLGANKGLGAGVPRLKGGE
jgi:hypothetical protein